MVVNSREKNVGEATGAADLQEKIPEFGNDFHTEKSIPVGARGAVPA